MIQKESVRLAGFLKQLSRKQKLALVITTDLSITAISNWMALSLQSGAFVYFDNNLAYLVIFSVLVAFPLFHLFGLYRTILSYSGIYALISICKAIFFYSLIYSCFVILSQLSVPKTIGLIQPILLFLGISGSRFVFRVILETRYKSHIPKPGSVCAVVYGAGDAGRQLVTALNNRSHIRFVGFIDDDNRLHGHLLCGLPVFGAKEIPRLRVEKNVTDVILAMPSVLRKRRNEILEFLLASKINVTTLPSLEKLADGSLSVSDLIDPDIDDLIGREVVSPSFSTLQRRITGKNILVTGAGGSIGSELCRQLILLNPKQIILFDNSEYALYQVSAELSRHSDSICIDGLTITPILGSIQDAKKISDVTRQSRPDIVFHAAAYKHVPLIEENAVEGVKNNVFGTLNVARAAVEACVQDCVLVSTDKAVRPTNVMGATKRLAEMIFQAFQAEHGAITSYSMVRFGNVLASSGSVIPKFKKQIRDGGPLTVTHPEVTRFFMTIPEAAQLVIQAYSLARGGDVFILDMGEPVKILELARKLIKLSGLTERTSDRDDGDIEIVFTGLRPGEKLYEELLIEGSPEETTHPKIFRAEEDFLLWTELEVGLGALKHASRLDHNPEIMSIVRKLIT